MQRRVLLLMMIFALALTGGCVRVNVYPDGSQQQAKRGGPPPGPPQEKPKDPFKPWEEVLKDTKAIDGFFTFHLSRNQGLFLEVPVERLGQEFGLLMHYSRGLGVFNVHDGLPLTDTQLLKLRRVGDKVFLVRQNPRFTADAGSPMRVSLDDNTGNSLVASFDIKSIHKESGNLLLELTGFVVSDYPDVGRRLKRYHDNKPVKLAKDRSFVSVVKGFPRNVEIDVDLTFTTTESTSGGREGLSDYRSIPVGVRYSFFALPDEPMVPRLADDRVGFFLTAIKDLSRDQEESPYVRYVNRWRLEKAEPQSPLSEPVKPIVYYVDRTVPVAYRKYVREGIEAWNKAFEAAGFKNAIVGKLAPSIEDDPDWSAEDVRYSTVRWSASHRMGYAVGPSQVDPRTGEILNADVLLSSAFVRSWLFDYQEWAGPEGLAGATRELERLQRELPQELAGRTCIASLGRTHQMAMQYAVMVGMGEISGAGPMPEEYVGEAIRDLVMHEVGHTLGLRHNFRSSASVPNELLHDKEYTRKNGVYHSVMDYTPVNVSLDRKKQGYYWNPEVGIYDVWAIRYGYGPIYQGEPFVPSGKVVRSPEGERQALAIIAAQGTDPNLAYGTDEDNWLGPWAVDPLTNAWDLGADPLTYLNDRIEILEAIQPRLEQRLIAEGESYTRLRQAVGSFVWDRHNVVETATRMVGGITFVRHHKGDPNGRPPFEPLSRATQRKALDTIVEAVFSADAFRVDAELLNKLAPSRWSHWGQGGRGYPVDYPIHQQVLEVQSSLLETLLQPPRLKRILDNELRMPHGGRPFRLAELFDTLGGAVWVELDARGPVEVSSMRRNLQRAHIDALTALLVGEPAASAPEDARSLSRYELGRVVKRLERALQGDLDTTTRAHFVESQERIKRALEASLTLSLPARD